MTENIDIWIGHFIKAVISFFEMDDYKYSMSHTENQPYDILLVESQIIFDEYIHL